MRRTIVAVSLLGCGCMAQNPVVGGPQPKPVLMQDMTLDNMLKHLPSGQDYIEAPGHGLPPDGEKDQAVRRRVSENAAIIAAQQKLIEQLERMVSRDKIQDILRQAEVGPVQYGYDDACNLTLRIPKEVVFGKKPIE